MHVERPVSTTPSLTGEEDDDIFGQNLNDPGTYDEKKWTRGHLRSQFETLELYHLFRKYTDKIGLGYFSLFLILTFFLFGAHTILLVVESYKHRDLMLCLVPDLVVYSIITFLSVIGLVFLELNQKRQKNCDHFCVISFIIIFIANFALPFYHDLEHLSKKYTYTTAYTYLLVIGSYVFFGVSKNWVAAALGVFVSTAHMCFLIFVSHKDSPLILSKVFSDIIFLTCFNGLGIYFRYLNEIVQRKSFLDRRDCIVHTFQLKYEKEQEEQLMASIIPAPLISKVKDNYLRNKDLFARTGKLRSENPFKQELLEVHEGVTILFADIVNYTVMTKKLNINSLLETLNELFGRFDDASERLKVIRIKFLGDCYYCVSGLPPHPPSNPAEACVDLGLKMIKIIADVREKNNLTIDMRIGIHTGKTISGIIGKVKYQFDIWSKDVDIANKMESEGVAGKVHITNKTKALLAKPYDIVPTDKGNTVSQFQLYNLQTFLVSPVPVDSADTSPNGSISEPEDNMNHITPPRTSIFRKKGAPPNLNQLHHLDLHRISEQPRPTLTIIESNNLDQDMQRQSVANGDVNGNRRSTIYHRRASQRFRGHEDRRSTADVKRRTAFMSGNFKRYHERSAIVDKEMEKAVNDMSFSKKDQYIKGKEISSLLIFQNKTKELEYVKMKDPMFKYYVLSQVVLIVCMYIIQNVGLDKGSWVRYEFIASILVILLVLLPSTWTYFLYLKYYTNFIESSPKNCIIRFFYNTSRNITYNFWFRLGIYTLVWFLFLMCVFIEVWWCQQQNVDKLLGIKTGICMIPWHMTQSCAIALIMTFLFLKIFIWIKLLYALLTTILYSYCALYYATPLYEESETFNPYLSPQLSHILSIAFLTFTLHLIDRQTDYMNRLDFLWTTKLLEEKKKADEQRAVNTNMLINILPKHVAKIYLDVNNEMKELYYETHNHVAVMFASMIFDDAYMEDENSFLSLMNEYITIIDTLINRKEFSKVEKIKIAKWTYMAACGLNIPGENDNIAHSIETHHTSSTLEVLLNFASDMFKQFKDKNGFVNDIQLRIGICHGPIVAGVVGSKKPLYDIWGDAVNMASRMDSTGSPGKIHVLAKTAQQIEKLGYECEPRGVTKVKGAGDIMTYFVNLDKDFNLIKSKNCFNEESYVEKIEEKNGLMTILEDF